jgi:type I restriction enzyme, S subunit
MQLLSLLKELSLHPKNAEELKGLIIRLALRGKLTENWRKQNDDVINASELLKRIHKDKEDLIEKRKLRPNNVKEIKTTKEMMYDIPNTWHWYNFSDVVFFQEGPGIRKWQFRETGVKLLNVQNIVGDTLVLENTDKHVEREEFEEKYQHFKVEEGDLLFASSGGSWGKSAWFVDPGYDVMLNTSMIRMCFYGREWFPDYLKTFVSSGFFVDQMTEQLVGIQPNFGSTHLSRIYIPIPPLEEQKAIVEVVNQLFAEVEQLEALTKERISLKEDFVTSALRRLTETHNTATEWNGLKDQFSTFFSEKNSVKKLREAILQLAVQGKLTAKWREVNPEIEPASELLKRIEAEKKQLIKEKKIKKEAPLPAITKDEVTYDLPKGWVWCRMGQIAEKLGAGSTPSGGKTAYVEQGIMFFRSQNIYNQYLKLEDVALIPESTHEKMSGTKVQPKDILLNITGGSIGRCAFIPDDFTTANVSQHVAIVRMIELETSRYIHQFIISPGFQDRIMDVQVGVSREGLSMAKLKMFPTPLPPLEEQKAIVEQVNSLMALCDELEQQIEISHTQVEQLMQSCLKEVFEIA